MIPLKPCRRETARSNILRKARAGRYAVIDPFLSRIVARLGRAVVRLALLALSSNGLLKLAHQFTSYYGLERKPDGRLVFPYIRRRQGSTFQILVYHRVVDEPDVFLGGLSIKVFAAQMEYLARYASVLPLREVLARLNAKEELPPWTVTITFDDGYRDIYDHAFPILRKYGLPATIFLVSEYVGPGKVIWYDQVFSAFRITNRPRFDLWEEGRILDLTTPSSRQEALHTTRRALMRLPEAQRIARVQEIRDYLQPSLSQSTIDLMLHWEHIREMAKENISFGSHTATHPILTTLSPERVMEELTQSKQKLEQELGIPVDLFAYPNGMQDDFDHAIKEMVCRAGYRAAVTTMPGSNHAETDRYELRRGTPWESEITQFAMHLNWYRFAY